MIRVEIAEGGGGIASLALHTEEDIYARIDWSGCGGLRTEMGDSLTMDGIILIVEGDDNLGGLSEMLGGSVPGEETFPNKEHKVHKGP